MVYFCNKKKIWGGVQKGDIKKTRHAVFIQTDIGKKGEENGRWAILPPAFSLIHISDRSARSRLTSLG